MFKFCYFVSLFVFAGEVLAFTVTPTRSPVTTSNSINHGLYSYFSKYEYVDQVTNTDLLTNLGIDISTTGKMKDHFRKGMKLFLRDKWEAATPELIASTVIIDPYTWNYWYAEAYATLGIIYEFHNTDSNHNDLAYLFYKLALKHDPKTFSARYYIKSVRPKKVNHQFNKG